MKFISNPKQLANTFEELSVRYSYFEWAVAWAGDPSSTIPGDILKKHIKKADRIIVGLHFYQTHPNFIERYMSNESFKFIKQVDGTYHPKLYVFYNDEKDWAILMGSSNLTIAGFNQNTEANILVTSNDSDMTFYMNVKTFIEEIWNDAAYFDIKELASYKKLWAKQHQLHSSLGHIQNKNGRIVSKTFDLMTWDEYEAQVHSYPHYDNRIVQLKKSKQLFKTPFSKLTDGDRKRLAGVPTRAENNNKHINWNAFGHMGGYGDFSRAIIKNDFHIAKAIDSIPMEGNVSHENYNSYIKEFMKAFPNAKNPLSSATRLLSLKRPDIFVCVDGPNKKKLCNQYDIPHSKLTVDTYWELLIERIRQDVWYNEKVISELKKYQVAMLDCIYYDFNNEWI